MFVFAAATAIAEVFSRTLRAVGTGVARNTVANQAFAVLFIGAGSTTAAIIWAGGVHAGITHPSEFATAFATVEAHTVVWTPANRLSWTVVLAAIISTFAWSAFASIVHTLAESLSE